MPYSCEVLPFSTSSMNLLARFCASVGDLPRIIADAVRAATTASFIKVLFRAIFEFRMILSIAHCSPTNPGPVMLQEKKLEQTFRQRSK